jgi:predicted porin
MKKTLIALAAVAVTSTAFAQNVTLSGTIDVGFQKRFSGDAFAMTGDRNGTSNWTLSGSEDLGGGMKANFRVSTSFNPDTGTAGNASTGTNNGLGNNGMFVELQGGFGQLRAGRPVHLLWGNVLAANGTKGVSAHDSASLLGGNGKNAGALSGVYVDNAVQYFSPRMGGLQVQLEFAPKEATVGANNGTGVALNYIQGPLVVTFTNYKGAKATAGAKQKAVNQLAASYDFGVARVLFTWRDQGGLASNQDTSYALGVTAPVGPGSVYASYNVNEQAAKDGRTVIAGYKYNLSKRTQAYVNVANRNAAWIPGTAGAKSTNGYGFGLQHNF